MWMMASLFACSGGPVEPPGAAAWSAPDLPSSWGQVPQAADVALRTGPRTCKGSDLSLTLRPDLSFEAANARAKFAGTWRYVDEALVYLTRGPLDPWTQCSAARVLAVGDHEVLLCAEGPLGCGTPADWAVEVVDDGAGAEATELVARVLTGLPGEGVVFRGEVPALQGGQVQIVYRPPPDHRRGPRELAEQAGALLERDLELAGVDITEDPGASSPVVVRVDGPVSPGRD